MCGMGHNLTYSRKVSLRTLHFSKNIEQRTGGTGPVVMRGKGTPGRENSKYKGLEVGLAWQVQGITRRPVWVEWHEEWEEK